MRNLRILVNNIELDHVREDMKVRRENSSFSKDLKVFHTTRPVRIVENSNAVDALGEFTISAIGKKKYFKCTVVMGSIRYPGILTQNEKIRGFRKCDLKYGSEVNEIMDRKVTSFFPAYNVAGAGSFPDYSEESDSAQNAGAAWQAHANDLKGKTFPEVHWQLPQMRWKDKFGEDVKPEDTHYKYMGYINNYLAGDLVVNRAADLFSGSIAYNANVISPQVFLLSPLHLAFQSIGYVLTGNFVKDPFFRRLMLLSTNDNMTKVVQKYPGTELDIVTPAWEQVFATGWMGVSTPTYAKVVKFTASTEGAFKVRYRFFRPWNGNIVRSEIGIKVLLNGERVGSFSTESDGEDTGDIPITIAAENVGQEIEVQFHSFNKTFPDEYLIEYAEDLPDVEFYDQHPTIDFSRYIPGWSVVEFLNNLCKTWNLRIEVDDIAREIRINFNEQDYLIDGEIIHIKKSLQVSGFKNISAESYLLKFASDSEFPTIVSNDPDAVQDENTVVIENPFKHIPHPYRTAELSEEVADKDGVGLILSIPGSPYTSDIYNGRSLRMRLAGGIYETYWKRWLQFRLNAGNAVLKGPFSQTELYQINRSQKIFVDNQLWLVKAVDFKENSIALFESELEVESVSF